MNPSPGRALVLAALLTLASSAAANDDCCFDWNNTSAGAGDIPGGAPIITPGPGRPGAPFGWSRCTGAPENGLGQPNCFSRLRRQGFVPGYSCVIGSPDPNGVLPAPNLPWGSGFQCVSRADSDMVNLSLTFINQITEPLGQENLVVFEEPFVPPVAVGVPALGAWGQWVLAALLGLGGALMLRRRTQPVHPGR